MLGCTAATDGHQTASPPSGQWSRHASRQSPEEPTVNGGFNRARQPAIPVPNRKRAARDHPHPERKTQYTHIRRQRIRARRCRSGREGLAACQKHPRVAPAAGWWHVRARAARQVAPRSRKDLRSTWHSASGKHKHASECGSVRGSVEGAARGSRASREGDSSRARLERNRAESIEWQQKNRLLGGGPAHTRPTRAYHTEYTAGTAARTCLCHDRI